LLTGVY